MCKDYKYFCNEIPITKLYIAGLEVNYGISTTIALEITIVYH